MKRIKDILLLSLLATCAVGCIDDSESMSAEKPEMSYIQLQISTGANTGSSTTRADGDVKSKSGENKINSVKVWLFGTRLDAAGETVGNRTLIGYAEDTNFGFEVTESSLYKYIQIPVLSQYLVNSDQTADVYVIANAESVGLSNLGETTSESELKAAVIGQDYFGAANPVSSSDYISGATAATSLPAARIVTGVKISDLMHELNEQRAKIVMQRAVSRIRFFAVKGTSGDDYTIEGVTIHEGFIPNQANIFPETVAYNTDWKNTDVATHASWPTATAAQIPASATYANGNISYTSTMTIDKGVETPEEYFTKATEETWAAYSERLETDANLYNVTYLRETADKPLTVTVTYTDGSGTKTKVQQLTDNIGNNFLRNHDVIVGMYLKQGQLYVEPTVLPWDLGGRYSYKTDVSAQLTTGQQYLRWDTDGDLSTWEGSFVAVTHEWEDQSQVPGRTPLILLKTTSSESMYLQLDNPKFEFVVETGDASNPYRELGVNQRLEISSGVNVSTSFFVRPVEAYNTAADPLPSREAHMSLVSNGAVPAKVPLRSSMPGFAKDVDEVWFYWISPSDYKEYADGTGPDGASSKYEN